MNRNSCFLLGFLLIFNLWGIVTISTLFYFLGIPTTAITFFLSVFLSSYIAKKMLSNPKETNIILVVLFLIFLISILLCGNIFDFSWDGNTYHKSIAGLLKEGWNPIYLTYDEAAKCSGIFPVNEWATWFDAYPKASSIIAAVFYDLTNNIESGKAYSLISCIAGCFILYSFLETYKSQKTNVIISVLLFFNPVSIAQINTFYNDAFLWNLLFITVVSLLNLTLNESKCDKKANLFLIVMCIGIGLNIKFSALIFFALVCGAFYIYWVMRICNNKISLELIKRITMFFLITVLFSVSVLGSTSYIKNTVLHCNPLYTMIGEDKTELIDSQAPQSFQNLSHTKRFLLSIFSVADNDRTETEIQLKIPFVIDKTEFNQNWIDTRVSGWGVYFSGILILSIAALIYLWKDLNKIVKQCIMLLMIISFLPATIVPGLFWARYWMMLFIIPIIAIYLLTLNNKKRIITWFLIIVCCMNLVLPLNKTIDVLRESNYAKMEYSKLKEISEDNLIEIRLNRNNNTVFTGLLFNIKDNNIENYIINNNLDNGDYISSRWGQLTYKIMEQNDES